MNFERSNLEKYIDKLKKRIPKNLIIESLSDKRISVANEYLKSRKNLEFVFSELTCHFGENWDYDKYPLGYIMRNTDNNSIVGFLGTICSRRNINNKNVVFANLVHWFVEKEFRVFGYAFLIPLLDKEIVVYATTPRNSIVPLYTKLGFEVKTMKYTVGVGINLKSMFSKNYKRFTITKNSEEILNNLNENEKAIYTDHQKYKCLHFIITDKKKAYNPCYVVAIISKRYHIKVFDILYVSKPEMFKNFSPEIFTKISFLFKKIFVGQRYFFDEEKFNYNPKFLTKTVNKFFPIKSYNQNYIFDVLYSDVVMFND